MSIINIAQGEEYNINIKDLHSEPDINSEVVYKIPADIKVLDFSKDKNWIKVEIKYYLGPIECKYTGWTHIPINEVFTPIIHPD